MLLRLVSGGGSLRVSSRASSVLHGRTAATASGAATSMTMTMSTAASIYVKENNDYSSAMQHSGIGDPTTASRMTKLDNGYGPIVLLGRVSFFRGLYLYIPCGIFCTHRQSLAPGYDKNQYHEPWAVGIREGERWDSLRKGITDALVLIGCHHCVFIRGGGLTRNGRDRPFIHIIVWGGEGGAIHLFKLMTLGFTLSVAVHFLKRERETENIYICYMNTKSHTLFFSLIPNTTKSPCTHTHPFSRN